MHGLWWRARTWIASGYRPVPEIQAGTAWMAGPALGGSTPPAPLVVIFSPTVVTARNDLDQRRALAHLAGRVAALMRARPDRRFVVWLGMQGDPSERRECARRLQAAALACTAAGVAFDGFVQHRLGKVTSLNAALLAAVTAGASAVIQVDDDVHLAPDCLDRVLRAYELRRGEAVVGATKIPVRRPSRTSGVLRWLRGQTGHACAYPHGCCIALNPHSPRFPIPVRYSTDDGYICFSWLRPAAAEPLEALVVESGATCRYFVGGAFGESLWRIRRMLLDTHVLLADFPRATAAYYFRWLLFRGLWPIGAPAAEGTRFTPVRWTLRLGYYVLFSVVGLELIVRGVLGRPLRRMHWAGLSHRDAPLPPSEAAF